MDDFGLHSGINDAALHLAALGRVSAIGCMVGGAEWLGGHSALRRLDASKIDIGLHLDLTERPLLAALPGGPLGLVAASLSRTLSRPAVRAEIRAQLDAFEQGMGRAPSFVDGHHHVHQFPVVRDELIEELERRHGSGRPWLRSTRGGPGPRTGWRETAKVRIIQALGAEPLATLARQHGFPQNRRLLGVYDFQGGPRRYRDLMAGWLQAAGDSDLLMCHPSRPQVGADPLIGARAAEFEVLASPAFGAMPQAADVRVLAMSRILQSPAHRC